MALVACGGGQATTEPTTVEPHTEPASGGASEPLAESGAGEAPVDTVGPDGKPTNEFVVHKTDGKQEQQALPESKIKPTRTEAALKFIVVDKETGPIQGIVVSLTAPDGTKYYTDETTSEGYAEVLVPVGKKYELVYLSLGRRDIAATVPVSDEPNQSLKLTLRYKRFNPPAPEVQPVAPPGFVLDGVTFDSGKAVINPESLSRLDVVVEYMTYKKSARIAISGHTDNLGNPKTNKKLSEKRAQACRDYLISKGIDGSRIEAAGYGDERPIASNDTPEGQQKNRRIEAIEL
jgi:outer membrane protein OmpA-like peptidoglycan-associated protein